MEDCSFVVPGSALSDIERICSDDEGEVSVAVGTKHILFKIGETVVVSRRLEGEFLNYRKSIPELFRFTVKVDKAEFMSSIDRVALIISESHKDRVPGSRYQHLRLRFALTRDSRQRDLADRIDVEVLLYH